MKFLTKIKEGYFYLITLLKYTFKYDSISFYRLILLLSMIILAFIMAIDLLVNSPLSFLLVVVLMFVTFWLNTKNN